MTYDIQLVPPSLLHLQGFSGKATIEGGKKIDQMNVVRETYRHPFNLWRGGIR